LIDPEHKGETFLFAVLGQITDPGIDSSAGRPGLNIPTVKLNVARVYWVSTENRSCKFCTPGTDKPCKSKNFPCPPLE